MGLLLGLVFEVPAKYAIIFIAVQYNVIYTADDNGEQFHFYDYGPKDIATIFFYMLVAINLHAVIQEVKEAKSSVHDDDHHHKVFLKLLLNIWIYMFWLLILFIIWDLLFIMVRLLTLTLSVLAFGFELARVENPGFSIADRNFNLFPERIGCLGAVCLTQAWMMWKFIRFQLKKWRDHVKNQLLWGKK